MGRRPDRRPSPRHAKAGAARAPDCPRASHHAPPGAASDRRRVLAAGRDLTRPAQWARAALWTIGIVSALLGADVRDDLPAGHGCSIAASASTSATRCSRPGGCHGSPTSCPRPVASVRREHLLSGKDTLAFSDAMMVPSLTAAPLRCGWACQQLLVYNMLLLSGFALSGAAMFLLVRSLTRAHGGGARRRLRVRLPAVPLHALRASRAADGAVDAALPVGVASDDQRRTAARRPADGPLPGAARRCRRSTTGSSSRPTWSRSGSRC